MADFGRILMGLLTGGLSEGLISAFNRHSKSSSGGSVDDFISEIEKAIKSQNTTDGNPSYLSKMDGSNSFYSTSEGNGIADLIAGWTGSRLTTAEEQANQFARSERIASEITSHNEAVDARMWQQYVEENKYGWNTQSMQNAGINPALVYGGGNLVGTAATGATGTSSPASSVSPSHGSAGDLFNMLFSLIRLPKEMKQLQSAIDLNKANAVKAEKEGEAAKINAETNKENAATNKQNADINQQNADTNRLNYSLSERRLKIEQMVAESNIKLNDQQISTLAAQENEAIERTKQIPVYAEAELMKASAAQQSAYAAVMNAKAALQNADTNSRMTDSQIALNSVLTSKEIVNLEWLPAEKRTLVEEARARGYFFNQQGQLCDKQGKLVDANTARAYVGLGCDVLNAGCNVIGTIASGGLLGGSTPKIGF